MVGADARDAPFDTLWTLTNVPYYALTSELTDDYDERSSLTTYRMVMAVPAYLVFGRSKFKGFIFARQIEDADMTDLIKSLREKAGPFLGFDQEVPSESVGRIQALEHLAKMPVLKGNQVELLVDGENTFASIFEGIDQASEYVLIQFFIIHDDELGSELKRRLCEKAKEGVRVFFLFDEFPGLVHRPFQVMDIEGIIS